MEIAILIPCYNEVNTISKVINDFKKELPNAKIYVYDNNSTDDTYEIARNEGAFVKKEKHQGKGNVVRSMFKDINADIYVMVDGDDTYPANSVHELISPVVNGHADMAVGDRLSNKSYKKENKRLLHNFGNNLVKWLINKLFNSDLKDIMSGYRAFNKYFVKSIPILSKSFEIETEITLHALDKRFNIYELPIKYKDRPDGSFSKLNTFRDGFKVIRTIIWIFKDYRPLLFFGTFSLLFFSLSLIIGTLPVIEYIKYHYVFRVPLAILAVGTMIFAIVLFAIGVILDTVSKQHKRDYEIKLNKFKSIYGNTPQFKKSSFQSV